MNAPFASGEFTEWNPTMQVQSYKRPKEKTTT